MSYLSEQAALTAVGELRAITTNGFNNGIIFDPNDSGYGSIVEYLENGAWDRQVDGAGKGHLYVCGGHHGAGLADKTVRYIEETNTWESITNPYTTYGWGDNSHGYDHNAFSPITNRFYYCHYGDEGLGVYNPATGTWGTALTNPYGSGNINYAYIYWPDKRSLFGYQPYMGYNPVMWNCDTGVWKQLTASTKDTDNYHQVVHYSSVFNCILYGGGNGGSNSKRIWRVNSDESITELSNIPAAIQDTNGNNCWGITHTYQWVDPVTGYLIIVDNNKNSYILNPSTDTWTTGRTFSAFRATNGTQGWMGNAPIPEYGVTMLFEDCLGSSPKVYLYRHAESASSSTLALFLR